MSAPPKRASRLEIIGVGSLVVVAAGAYFYLTLPSVSGALTVGTTTLQAERCSGFTGGVQIFLSGENDDAITAGLLADGSLRLTFSGEEVTQCTEARLEAAEGSVRVGRSSATRPVIGGSLTVDCMHHGEPLRGSFEFARCRQD